MRKLAHILSMKSPVALYRKSFQAYAVHLGFGKSIVFRAGASFKREFTHVAHLIVFVCDQLFFVQEYCTNVQI